MKHDVLRMPFDQYQRYRLVADLLKTLRKQGAPLSVLDVGGRTALLRGFLPDERITLVDVEPSEEKGLVLGDGARLPFQDDSFDVVAAFDTLEHVPPPLRRAFVRECGRVAKKWVVLAGPYHAPRVAEAEQILQRFLKDKLGFEHRYLEEHRHNGLPSREETEKELAALGAKVHSVGHANLERWLAMMCLSMYLDHDPALRGLATRVHEFYNRALYASDHAEPVYRHLVIAAFDGASMPSAKGLLGEPVAPRGALEPFTELAGELVAFDRERDAWREERAKIAQVTRDLATDLEGHKQTLDEVERDLSAEKDETHKLRGDLESERTASAEVIATLEADLGEHKKSIEALAVDLEAARTAYVSLEEHSAESIAALEADLAGHRARIDDLKAEIEALRESFDDERRQAASAIDALNQDLGAHKEALAHLEQELAAHQAEEESLRELLEKERRDSEAVATALSADLEEHKRTLAALEEDLEDARGELGRRADLLESERAQAASAIRALELDLTGHRAQMRELEELLEQTRRGAQELQRTLEADLAEHRGALATVHADLDAHRATLAALRQDRERELSEESAVRAALQRDLEEHRAVQAALEQALDEHRRVQTALTAELANTQITAREIQSELIRANESAQGLGRTLAAREQEIAELRALLRSRWKNAQRAFGLKKPRF